MNKKGYRISLDVYKSEHYEQFKLYFESMDKLSIDNAILYTSEIAYLLIESGVPAINMENNCLETLPGSQYRKSYIDGFNNGVNEFQKSWSLSPDNLYGPKSDHYFSDLRRVYEGAMKGDTVSELFEGRNEPGWLHELNTIPLMVNEGSIKQQGYYAGLVSKYRELEMKCDRLRGRSEIVTQAKGKEEEFKSLRRVRAFILTEAYRKGLTEIKTMKKKDFVKYVSDKFKGGSANAIYNTVRSTYKGESNFINYFDNMKREHSLDYDYAMRIFNDYYHDLI